MATHPIQLFPAGPLIPRGDVRELALVRPRPRIYLHRLAQHMTATPTQRRSLVVEQKYPSAFQLSYQPAKQLFADALRECWTVSQLRQAAADRWFSPELACPSSQHRRLQAIAAVAAFARILPMLQSRLANTTLLPTNAEAEPSPLLLANVLVSDATAIPLRRLKRGTHQSGLLSFHAAKTRRHTKATAENAAALLSALAAENCPTGSPVHKDLILIVDIFTGHITTANRGNTRRLQNAQAACEEIAVVWSRL